MDFGKMGDQLKEQMSEKIKEELIQKVDEVKADIETKFGMLSQSTPKQSGEDTAENERSIEPSAASETEEQPELDASGAAEDANTEDATSDSADLNEDDDRQKEVA